MAKKKAIECPKELGGCGAICVQVGKVLGYPKEKQERRQIAIGTTRERWIRGFEYRYTCPKCGQEWLEDTLFGSIEKIDEAAYHIRVKNGRELYYTTETDIAEKDGVVIGNEYSPEQLKAKGWW